MLGFFAFALVTLAAARVTRLLIHDTITEPMRRLLWRRLGNEVPPALLESIRHYVARTQQTNPRSRSWAWKLINCPWCLGFWVSLLLTAPLAFSPAIRALLPGPWPLWWPITALAASQLVGLLLAREE